MFRSFDVESREKFKFQLYKNRTEILGDIPNDFISNCVFKLSEPDTFDVTIPKYIGKDKKFNPLFNNIKSKQQIIVSYGDSKKRFIIEARKVNTNSSKGSKSFSAFGFEKTLERHRVSIEEGNYQLISDEVHIAKGVLELAVEGTKWKLGYVDEDARVEIQSVPITVPNVLYTNFEKNKVAYDTVLFERDIDTSSLSDSSALYITMEYNEVSTYKDGNRIKTENVFNLLEPLYTKVKHMKAIYFQEAGNRWGVKYELTLIDNTVETQKFAFTNVTDKDIKIKEIKMLYETGAYEEKNMVVYPFIGSYDDNVYNVLKDLEGIYNCTFVFDEYNKIINCYAKDNLGEDKGLMLSFDTNVIELNVNEEGSIPNAMKVIGNSGVSIASENIFGGTTIYNYDYYINEGLISQDLIDKWKRYLKFADTKREEWNLVKSNRSLAKSKQIKLSTEAQSLSRKISYGKEILATLIEAKDEVNQALKQKELEELEKRFNEVSAEINSLQVTIDSYDDEMLSVGDDLSRGQASDDKGKIFNEEDLEVFDDIEEVTSVTDSYYTIPYALLKHYEKELADKVVPTIDFDMSTDDLAKHILKWTSLVKLGDLYYVDKDMQSVIKQDKVRLLEINYDTINNRVTQVKFCNKDEKLDKLRNLKNTGRKQSEAVNTNNNFKNIWEDSRSSNNYVKSLRENGMTLVTNSINSRSDSCVLDMGSAGIWVMNAKERDKQIAITSGIIAITTDGWKTSDTAITSEFINADLLMGRIIAGENLYITSDTGGFYVGNTSKGKKVEDFGMKITDDGNVNAQERIFLGLETDPDGVRRAKLRLTSKDDNSVVLDETGILQRDTQTGWNNLSPGFPIVTYIDLDEGVSKIKEAKLKLRLGNYRGFTKDIVTSTTTSTTGASSSTTSGASSSSTSGASSSSTTTSSNNHRHIMLEKSDFQQAEGNMVTVTFIASSDSERHGVVPVNLPVLKYNALETNVLWTASEDGKHSHENPHTHNNPHTHDFPHTHKLDLNLQTKVETGIKLYEKASNVSVKINGQTIYQGISSDTSITITPYILTNTDNIIEISSATNGYIGFTTSCKYFSRF